VAERWLVRATAARASQPGVELRLREHDDPRWTNILCLLVPIDEYTRERLVIRVASRLGNNKVIEALTEVMLSRGIPEHIRSDNGPSSRPRNSESGWAMWERARCTSYWGVPGKTGTVRVSTGSCERNV